ncbi:glutamate synthase, partial [Chlorobaculum sp. 24CR]
ASIISGVPREEMACFENEYDDAKKEGATMYFQAGTAEVLGGASGVTGLRCTKMTKKEKGEEGWNSPIPFLRYKSNGESFVIEADMVVAAIGQGTDLDCLGSASSGPWLKVDR